ncbi:LOW QUALITY PROTEIN: hypothetical protein ACHAXR_001559 [Thalassiosira sp. AJA248-18]
MLKPFPISVGLSPHVKDFDSTSSSRDDPTTSSLSNSHFTFPPSNDNDKTSESQSVIARYIPPYNPSQSNDNESEGEEEPYDTAAHIITHLARDWAAGGESIRKHTYDWIVSQLWTYQSDSTCSQQRSPLSPVLVPGAGMARLAFDIAFAQSENDGTDIECYPFVVEAIDNSVVMATAAYQLLRHCSNNHDQNNTKDRDSMKIYPIVSDPFVNEVDTQRRWDSAVFREDHVVDQLRRLHTKQQSSNQPSLSYIVGDFVSTYASPSKHGMYGSIATCFFIDTATNIYEYVLTIRNLLRVWINLGPVQWHRNAQLQPSANELKDLIVLAGFQIMHWEISETLLAYRHPDDIRTGTRSEAYRPLKFVAVLQPDEYVRDEALHDDGSSCDLLSSMGKLRRSTGRRAMVNNVVVGKDPSTRAVSIVDD